MQRGDAVSGKESSDTFSMRDVSAGKLYLLAGLLFVSVVLAGFHGEVLALASTEGTIEISASDFVVFSTAVVGVLGSYSLYRRRRRDATEHLRQALFAEVALVGDQIYAEIQDITVNQLGNELYVPDETPIVLSAYQNNAGEIGRLSGTEVEKLTAFYTLASIVSHRVERLVGQDEVDAIEVTRLRRRFVELFNRRNEALEAMQREISHQSVEVKYRDVEEVDEVEELAEMLGIR